jgi:outer membrane protein TolC
MAEKWLFDEQQQQENKPAGEILAADDPVELIPPGMSKAGPLEINDELATAIAFDNRLDLRIAQGNVYDKQRKVTVKADRLAGELTLLGTAETGGRRTNLDTSDDNSRIEFNHAKLSSLLTLNLPIERTAERNDYRNSLIDLEKTIRSLQSLEDNIKLQIRNRLRALLSARESVLIQSKSVQVAEKRVRSTNMFLDVGRAQIRDLLEAQEARLDAQNSLTAAVKNYRIAELQIQRDMGLLEVNEKGLFKEIDPEVLDNAEKG